MQFEINWELPEAEFRHQIETLIRDARKSGMVIPLPCHITGSGLELMALVLSQVNCDNCDAPCCRLQKFAEFGIPFLATEYQALVERMGEDKLTKMGIKLSGNTGYIPTPCPFLHKNLCSIYDIRPLVCIQYPVESAAVDDTVGLEMLSLDPYCPEARRIAKRVYMTLWRLVQKAPEVTSQASDLEKGARMEEMLRELKRTTDEEGGK